MNRQAEQDFYHRMLEGQQRVAMKALKAGYSIPRHTNIDDVLNFLDTAPLADTLQM